MLRIMSRFFKKQSGDSKGSTIIDSENNANNKDHVSKAYAKGGKIAYHPELISELKQEHGDLLDLFIALVKSSRSGEKDETRNLLATFKRRLVSHILKENVQFYVYVKYLFVDDEVNCELAKTMQLEMSDIGKSVLDFIARSLEDKALYDSNFQKELDQIGNVLTERIKIEEERLYGLYLHPDAVS